MLERWQHRAGIAVAVAGLELGSAFGTRPAVVTAYVLAALLGLVLIAQGERRSVTGSISSNTLVGFAAGTVVCILVTAGLLMVLVEFPWDLALWRALIFTWASWAGIGAIVVSAFFVGGLVTTVR